MRILLVDDEESIRDSVGLILQNLGCTVTAASSGEEALEKFSTENPDLIFLDLYMTGDLQGLDVCGWVRQSADASRLPVVLMSAEMPSGVIAQGKRAGATDFLAKDPLLTENIKKIVSKYRRPAHVPGRTEPHAAPPPPAEAGLSLKIQKKLKEPTAFKPIPSIAAELMQVSSGASVDMNAIVNVIKKDVALTARILQLANSAIYRKSEPVYTLDRAVINIGLTGIREAGMGLSMVEQMLNSGVEGGLDRMRFCQHAMATGAIAYTLAQMAHYKNPEEMLLCGLVHDIGMTFFDEVVPKPYADLLARLRLGEARLTILEREIFGRDHQEVGEQILAQWSVPESIRATAAHHHESYAQILSSSTPWKLQVLTVRIADQLAQAAMLYDIEDDVLEEIPIRALELIGIFSKNYGEILERVDRDMEELNTILLLHGQAPTTPLVQSVGGPAQALLLTEEESNLSPFTMLLHGLRYTIVEGTPDQPCDAIAIVARTYDYAAAILDQLAIVHPPERTKRVLIFSGNPPESLRQRCSRDGVALVTPPLKLSKLRPWLERTAHE